VEDCDETIGEVDGMTDLHRRVIPGSCKSCVGSSSGTTAVDVVPEEELKDVTGKRAFRLGSTAARGPERGGVAVHSEQQALAQRPLA
jgi:hypothetical protein